MNSRSRTNIDNMIAFTHDIFIMFHNNDRISDLRESFEIFYEHIIISRMESDRWLIENIDNSLKARTNLRCESYTLRFSS